MKTRNRILTIGGVPVVTPEGGKELYKTLTARSAITAEPDPVLMSAAKTLYALGVSWEEIEQLGIEALKNKKTKETQQ